MANKPFDASFKDLIEDDAQAWAAQFNPFPVRAVTVIDADVATVTAAADKVLRVEDEHGVSLLNIEAEGRYAADAPGRMLLYSTVLGHRHGLPVRSVLLLLCREANASNLTGVLEKRLEGENEPYLVFRYRVVRVWEQSAEAFLKGGLGIAPLAALTDEAAPKLGEVVRRIDKRIREEAPPAQVGKMRSSLALLLGLRYEEEQIMPWFSDDLMELSSVYQLILSRGTEKGKLEEARRMLLRPGRIKFGEPDAATVSALEAISDINRLEELSERLLQVSTWKELLAAP
jgi:predicted transposase YdaD